MSETGSPISFPVNVARLPQRGMPVVIEATADQRAALAEAHGLEDVLSFRADLHVGLWKRNGVRVTGKVTAKVVQSCVVTLDPVENEIDEDIDQIFLPDDSKLGREGFGQGGEIVLNFDGDDSPETFSGDWIDVGALAEEFFGLGIDPYPHKPGVETADIVAEDTQPEPAEGSLADKLKAALSKNVR